MAKSTKVTGTGVAKLTTNDIPGMLEKINESLKALKGGSEDKHKAITSHLEGYGKISSINSVERMIQAYASVAAREKAYNDAAEKLGIDTKKYPCKIDKIAPESWKKEIELRVLQVKNQVEIKELEEIKEMLEDNLSLEDKLAKKLQKGADALKAFNVSI